MRKIYRFGSKTALLLLGIITIVFAGSSFFESGGSTPVSVQFSDMKRTCGTVDFNEQQMNSHPEFRENRKLIEEFTKTYTPPGTRMIITIPVVVHVVYNTSGENISDAQVLSQIEAMNKDFARLNSDTNQTPGVWKPIAANTQIQFCLAQRDPSGNPTTGITRTQTSITQFTGTSDQRIFFTAQGGRDIWDRDRYLNIYSCNLGGGLLGYAQQPGGPPETDGSVNLYTSVGTVGNVNPPYDKGRTVTHEVGHWLNLNHIWGDEPACSQDDEVADTPLQGNSSSGCPTFPTTDACQTSSPGIMFMNYMDYSNDACMNLFTLGQAARMNAALAGPRASILLSNACTPIGITPIGTQIPAGYSLEQNYPNPFNPVTNIHFSVPRLSFVKLTIYDAGGRVVSQPVSRQMAPGTYNVDFEAGSLSSGIYFYTLEAAGFSQTKKMLLVK